MKVTIKDIAKFAGVSTATVSKVINHKDENISQPTREKILNIMKEYNYIPNTAARSLVTKKTKTIGLVIPDIRNPFFHELARGAEDKANEEGYNIIFCNTDDRIEKEEKYVSMLIEKMVDGIIFTAASKRMNEFEHLRNNRVPIILVDRDIDLKDIKGKITVDNCLGAYEGVKHLLSCGYKNIIFLSGPLSTHPSIERLKGYKRALEEFHIPYKEENIFEGTYQSGWGYETVKMLLKKHIDFDALFCGNDLIAIEAVKALKEAGIKVPKEVGIVGFDDIYMATLVDPELTTIRQPSYEIGYSAVEMLINILEKKVKTKEKVVLNTELIIRKSTMHR
ncbi:LacI family DNA-binding transcriptional regulator [Marinisporobacter balticus]|uniref:LacI family transcriptional regulator n=1 Tax=Marinisporobacter balticus TaxID=2018667 RepID=A0A4R2KSW7_9FIRM|nr:LacI family DNA-binding transcriptional regulator [Marinisporobacter balticus]TCO77471.1 LacI family transcriptional regulator [Marinisporobacter balticus]